ncbi:flagellar hook-length control protein FliK [Pusillimonas sp.]|uniref:flagellar hook-length control protein FliK n=1 Tax=Pusillimonas sp. TaxID=3040095 RepID=UPI0029BD5284|nr:flagellar hook-length control protein FliK [Pusillimonas sp.]MDX3894111.1 flagellar hook-length control protein FliK [Pusillimonas sp.]
MNSPTIAAVVPGLAPQAGRAPSAEDAAADSPRFADVLAGQSPAAAKKEDRTDARAQAKSTGGADHSVEDGDQAAKANEPAESDKAGSEPDAADGALAALPQIALEIALHARGRAGRTDPPSGGGLPIAAGGQAADVRSDASRRHTASGKEPFPGALRAEALANAQASTANGPETPAIDTTSDAQASASGATAAPGPARATSAELAAVRRKAAAQFSSATNTESSGAQPGRLPGAANGPAAPALSHAGDAAFAPVQTSIARDQAALQNTQAMPAVEAPAAASAGASPFAQTGTASFPAASAIATPLHHADWNTDFGRRVIMLARDAHGGTQTAELRLDPPELGPLRISISLNDGMANAVFVSAHASVRQAVESALPQLSQQLAQAGISLGQTHVGDHGQAGFAFHDEGGQSGGRAPGAGAGHAAAADASPPPRVSVASNGLVDTFA